MEKFKNRRTRAEEKRQSSKPITPHASLGSGVWYKRKWVIITAVVSLVLIVMLAVSLILLTIATNNRVNEMQQARERSQAHLAEFESIPEDSTREQRLAKIDTWTADLDELKCGSKVGLPWLADTRQQCKGYNETRAAVKKELEATRGLMQYDMALQGIFTDVIRENEIKDITAELAVWQDITRQLEQLSRTEVAGEIHGRLEERVGTIRDTWQEMKTANDEQNSETFRKLEESLPEKYSNLQMVREELLRAYDMQQHELVQAVKAHHQK